jgi:hypothetical protein
MEPNADFLGTPVAADVAGANTLVVSLHALAGIRTEKTLLLSIMIKGKRLLALLDTGQPIISSMGTRCVASSYLWRVVNTSGVTVANGDRLPCNIQLVICMRLYQRRNDNSFICMCVIYIYHFMRTSHENK